MFTPTNHVISGPDLHRVGPLTLWGFSQDLPAKYRWRKKKSHHLSAQTWRHGGAYRGRAPQLAACAPPNENCVPPCKDCAPKKITVSGLLERNSRPKLVFFVNWHWILWRFWDEDLFSFFFFWRSFFYFLEITCFRPEKPLEIPIAAGKSLEIFAPHLFHFIQSGINFSCPSRIHAK